MTALLAISIVAAASAARRVRMLSFQILPASIIAFDYLPAIEFSAVVSRSALAFKSNLARH
jgi:hypothetical protein